MSALSEVIDYIQTQIATLDGMRQAPKQPPESANVFPFAICYAANGEWMFEAGRLRALHTVMLEVHIARVDLARDVAASLVYSESVVRKIMADVTLGGLVDTILMPIMYSYGRMEYAGQLTLGWQFRITFKQHVSW